MDFKVMVSGVPVANGSEPLRVAYTAKPAAYWVRSKHSKTAQFSWVPSTETQLRRLLKSCKLNPSTSKGDDLSEVDQALMLIERDHRVDHAIALAGYEEGHLMSEGHDILVTRSCQPVKAVEGDWANLKRYIETLLGEEVFPYQMAWWQWARQNFKLRNSTLPGQVMVYVGKSGWGKSYFQNKVTTPLLGGHASDPFRYMSGGSSFNSDLFRSEHLVMEDKFTDTGGKGRREFGAKIKELAVNAVQSCHAKGADAITLRPKWRVSVSMNDEAENMQVLPPLDESIMDKLMLIQCRPATTPVDLDDIANWNTWDGIVKAELPALAYAIDNFEIPARLKSARYGVKAWHDQKLIDQERDSSVEAVFLDILMHDLPTLDATAVSWDGSSTELERLLLSGAMPSVAQARKLLSWRGAVGTYLGRLASQHPATVSKRKVRGTFKWKIILPTQ